MPLAPTWGRTVKRHHIKTLLQIKTPPNKTDSETNLVDINYN